MHLKSNNSNNKAGYVKLDDLKYLMEGLISRHEWRRKQI
jgi:hypothetical protein